MEDNAACSSWSYEVTSSSATSTATTEHYTYISRAYIERLLHCLWPPYVIGQAIYIFILSFVLLPLHLLFSSPNLSRRRLDVYHTSTHTWCGLSANLECRSETCCTRLAEKYRTQKSPKSAIWAPSHNFVGLYLRN